MVGENTQGICPHCEQPGTAGQPCAEQLCQKKGYHFIPREFVNSDSPETPDAIVGLSVRDFVVVGLLGVGGFGRVYLAVEPTIGLQAALKLLDLSGLPKSVERAVRDKFDSEARALALLQHPNILSLMHFGSFQQRPYLLTEFIEGGVNLEDEIEKRAISGSGFSIEQLQDIFRQLLDGLEAAHQLGIIHRDIKPANLMIQDTTGYRNFLKILDFGLAKFLDMGNATMATSGTPDYMSPEQVTRENLGPWTDLYAVGIIAYELFTGRRAFTSENIQETFFQKVDPTYDPTARLRDLALPPDVTSFLQRALHSDFRKRYQNVEAFRSGIYKAIKSLADPANPSASRVSLFGLSRHASAADTQPIGAYPKQTATKAQPVSGDLAFRQWVEKEQARIFKAPKKPGPSK